MLLIGGLGKRQIYASHTCMRRQLFAFISYAPLPCMPKMLLFMGSSIYYELLLSLDTCIVTWYIGIRKTSLRIDTPHYLKLDMVKK